MCDVWQREAGTGADSAEFLEANVQPGRAARVAGQVLVQSHW